MAVPIDQYRLLEIIEALQRRIDALEYRIRALEGNPA